MKDTLQDRILGYLVLALCVFLGIVFIMKPQIENSSTYQTTAITYPTTIYNNTEENSYYYEQTNSGVGVVVSPKYSPCNILENQRNNKLDSACFIADGISCGGACH